MARNNKHKTIKAERNKAQPVVVPQGERLLAELPLAEERLLGVWVVVRPEADPLVDLVEDSVVAVQAVWVVLEVAERCTPEADEISQAFLLEALEAVVPQPAVRG